MNLFRKFVLYLRFVKQSVKYLLSSEPYGSITKQILIYHKQLYSMAFSEGSPSKSEHKISNSRFTPFFGIIY